MTTKCLIVDDEPLAIKLIENHLSKFKTFQVAGTCDSGIEAFEFLKTEQVDLIFLDINLPELSGLDFLKSLENPPKIILTTAYREYAAESYELDVVDYLLKPITFKRFLKAIDRFSSKLKTNNDETTNLNSSEYIILKSGNDHIKIVLSEVLFVESFKDYIDIQVNETKYTVKYKIGDFEKRLNKHPFRRVHKSYIVNEGRITSFNRNHLMVDKFEIPIGISYKSEVFKLLDRIKSKSQ
ncbi:LytR/AlgR family response regulator transcription factor [Aequorivita capsosiphonis]|uniref:LytR/AlgR family response regulator transcription factor n=1 Tax=Aequorivita capsosiphonis TaxID=487317 RepID=UPI0004101C89|nr:response regulator [Aequorivita capsosiphonis]